jgi:hypothetical protein
MIKERQTRRRRSEEESAAFMAVMIRLLPRSATIRRRAHIHTFVTRTLFRHYIGLSISAFE